MNPATLALILLSVTISALAQISLKLGMSSSAVQHAMTMPTTDLVYAVMRSPALLAGLVLYGLGMIVWLSVLAKIDVSQAYPFMGLGIVLTFAIGYLFLHEPINSFRAVGMLLVVGGIVLVAQG
jgi:drug/metabolite transporter (DMT)-like permease